MSTIPKEIWHGGKAFVPSTLLSYFILCRNSFVFPSSRLWSSNFQDEYLCQIDIVNYRAYPPMLQAKPCLLRTIKHQRNISLMSVLTLKKKVHHSNPKFLVCFRLSARMIIAKFMSYRYRRKHFQTTKSVNAIETLQHVPWLSVHSIHKFYYCSWHPIQELLHFKTLKLPLSCRYMKQSKQQTEKKIIN